MAELADKILLKVQFIFVEIGCLLSISVMNVQNMLHFYRSALPYISSHRDRKRYTVCFQCVMCLCGDLFSLLSVISVDLCMAVVF
jgi:hypothetical protein